MITRTVREMMRLETFEERFEYLRLDGVVGEETFGFDRWVNQAFYRSEVWRRARREVIVRDRGMDLAVPGRPINGAVTVHHINPLTISDLTEHEAWVVDPNYLVCVSHDTHNAIHYGDENLLLKDYEPRTPGDTLLW